MLTENATPFLWNLPGPVRYALAAVLSDFNSGNFGPITTTLDPRIMQLALGWQV